MGSLIHVRLLLNGKTELRLLRLDQTLANVEPLGFSDAGKVSRRMP